MFGLLLTAASVLSTVTLATVVLATNRRSVLHRFLFLLAVGFAGSIGANYFTTYFTDPERVLTFIRLTMLFAGLAVPSWYLFLRNFPQRTLAVPVRQVVIAGAVSVGLMALALSPWMFRSVTITDGAISPTPGPALAVFFGAFGAYLVGMVRSVVRKLRTSYGIERVQLWYVLAATVVSFGIIIAFNVLAPLVFGASALVTVTNVGPLLFTAIVAYTIVRYRLLDVRIILKRTTVYALTFAGVLGGSAVLLSLGTQPGSRGPSLGWSLAVITLGLVAYRPLLGWVERLANHYFFTSLYNSRETLAELGRGLTHTIDLQRIVTSVVETIKETMQLDRAGVLLFDRATSNYRVVKTIGFNEANGISLVRSNFLTHYLAERRRSVLLQELEGLQRAGQTRGDIGKLIVNMRRIEAAVCLPLTFGPHLIGIVVLGQKVSKDAYTAEDLQLLDSIANQASIAIQNGLLYRQVEDFNRTLQAKVDTQTRDIKEKNAHLEELVKMKSEFLSIASHQLRTPLTAVRGLLSMQADGDFDQLPEVKRREQQRHMLAAADHLNNIVNDLLDAMELEGGHLAFTFAPTDVMAIIRDVAETLKPNFDQKGLSLTVREPTTPLPQVDAEPKYLREAIMDVIDNAEKYTSKGGVTVTLAVAGDQLTITVTDTGIGITKTDLPRLFKKFSRGERSAFQHANGSGLGLFIIRNIMREHHGDATIASPGEGKGTTVTLTLPLRQAAAAPAAQPA